ncbi:hypothetical protein, partial [Janthinobacterium sp.]|uniref:hypothetical protein n=1 Tax=Janthinobacterium sp. TaxID=1871054 RepID=UPI00258C678F
RHSLSRKKSSICAKHKVRTCGAALICGKMIEDCRNNQKHGFNRKETFMSENKYVREHHQVLEIIIKKLPSEFRLVTGHYFKL